LTAVGITISHLAVAYAQTGTSLIVATATGTKTAGWIINTFAAVSIAIVIASGTCHCAFTSLVIARLADSVAQIGEIRAPAVAT